MRFHLHTLAIGLLASTSAWASPWAEVGDNALRADVAVLASSGVVDNVTSQWALPWGGVLSELSDTSLSVQSATVRAAAARVRTRGLAETVSGFSGSLTLGAATSPSVVYGFNGLGRGAGQAQLSLAYASGGTAMRLSVGAFTTDFTGRTVKFMPDGSFIAQKIGDTLVYAGYLSHWWGPGWISALALSNNARPMPQIGIQRISSEASGWPVLDWLGPWRAEFFIGLMDDPRIDRNTVYNALHFAFNPLPGLEIGLARTEQLCGKGHPCVPLRDTLHFTNDPTNINYTNAQGQIDIKWSHAFLGVPAQFYMSVMNEDSSPITHSGTTHLFGVTAFAPMPKGSPLRLTVEYSDSVPTEDIFSFGKVLHGFSYNNGGYLDGMRYRGRTMGFSLDSDSRLLSLQAGWSDPAGRFYELSVHNAHVSNPNNGLGNTVTSAPVRINMAEARVGLPWHSMKLDLALRLQDDQPRPRSGLEAGFDIALRAPL
jgi:hypothetical protein